MEKGGRLSTGIAPESYLGDCLQSSHFPWTLSSSDCPRSESRTDCPSRILKSSENFEDWWTSRNDSITPLWNENCTYTNIIRFWETWYFFSVKWQWLEGSHLEMGRSEEWSCNAKVSSNKLQGAKIVSCFQTITPAEESIVMGYWHLYVRQSNSCKPVLKSLGKLEVQTKKYVKSTVGFVMSTFCCYLFDSVFPSSFFVVVWE